MLVAVPKSVLRAITLGGVALSLSGCQFVRAVTFTSDDVTSFQRAGSEARIDVYPATGDCLAGPPNAEAMAAFGPGLAAAAAVIALNVTEGEIQGYLDRKQKEFVATYAAATSVDAFYRRRANYVAGFNCIRIRRSVEPSNEKLDGSLLDDGRPLAMELVVRIVPSPNRLALKLRPERVQLIRAAARTDNDGKDIEISARIKIDAIARNEKGVTTAVTVVDKVLTLPDLHTTGDRNRPFTVVSTETQACREKSPGDKIGEGADQYECRVLRESSWFEAVPQSALDVNECGPADDRKITCLGVTPATFAVSVTETGSGADTFGDASKVIDDNKSAFNDAIRDAIKDALTKSQ